MCKKWRSIVCLCLVAVVLPSYAANTPCSGRKGGVDYCMEGQFVCKDGSISASKKVCSSTVTAPPAFMPQPAARNADCSCRSGAVCTGPRGGRYCLSDSGRKSYLRK